MTGHGIDVLKRELEAALRHGRARPRHGVFRLAIDRSFTVAGHGTVVTGTVASGSVAVGDELEWLPTGRTGPCPGPASPRPAGRAGSAEARGPPSIWPASIIRRSAGARNWPPRDTSNRLGSSRLTWSRPRESVHRLRHRGRYKLHLGTAEVPAVLSLLEPDETSPGPAAARASSSLAEPIVAVHGEPFVLREESPPATLGGGRVVQPVSRRYRRRDRTAIERLGRLDRATRSIACVRP